jgi:CRISPR/Cas system CMR subunit Cmr6 (Cas7 group RAMP superfamily)
MFGGFVAQCRRAILMFGVPFYEVLEQSLVADAAFGVPGISGGFVKEMAENESFTQVLAAK